MSGVQHKQVTLSNGIVLHKVDGMWPSYQHISKDNEPCAVCPIAKYCEEHKWFQCITTQMFSGFELKEEHEWLFDNPYDRNEAIERSQTQ